MRSRSLLFGAAIALIGLGGFILFQTFSVDPQGEVWVGRVNQAAACREADCRPAIRLHTLDGAVLDEAALAGKTLLVNWWAPWCAPCVQEMPALEGAYQRHADKLVILGVVADETPDASVRAFLAGRGVTYPIGRASELPAGFDRPTALPTSQLYDPNRKAVKRWQGAVSERELEREVAKTLR